MAVPTRSRSPAAPVRQPPADGADGLRRNPLDMAPAPIEAELAAQLEARNERRKAARPKRPKATYDLTERQQRLVAQMAQAEGVSLTDIVALAVVRLHDDLRAGLDLTPLKQPARSLKATYKLDIPGAAQP